MSRRWIALGWGVMLAGGGALWVLQNVGLIPSPRGWPWGLGLGLAGLLLLGLWLRDRAQVAPIPLGVFFLAVGILIVTDDLFPNQPYDWGGPFFFCSIGLGFLLIYRQRRDLWWVLLPAGLMFTLAVVVLLSPLTPGIGPVVVLLVGLAATFAALSFLPGPHPLRWPLLAALGLALLGISLGAAPGGQLNYLQSALLVVLGVLLVYRGFRPWGKKARPPESTVQPPEGEARPPASDMPLPDEPPSE